MSRWHHIYPRHADWWSCKPSLISAMDHPPERLVGATTLQGDQVCSSDAAECLVDVQLSMMFI